MVARLASTIAGLLAAILVIAPAAQADPAQTGRWSALQQYPVIPISAAVLPDGNIVAWDQADPGVPHGLSPNNGKAIVIDPDKGVIARSANLAPTSVFCTLITTLPDGKVALVGGGNETYNSDRNVLYDPETKTFGAWGNMSRGRWYPGGQIDKDGNIVALGGRGGNAADFVTAATGVNRRLSGVGFDATYYPHVVRMPDGRFTVESISQTNAPVRSILNTAGTGSLTPFANRTLLQPRLRLTSTMVGPYTSLMIGGGTLRTTYTLDVSSGTPVARASGTMRFPRITATAVTLPDGSALTIGGNASGSETTGVPVMTPELWDPATGQWSSMADSPRQRQYHSVAALLPDGRVWSAGTSARGVDEYNGAYFTPPNLFKKDGSGELASRPVVQDAPSSVAWGQTFSVRSPQAASIRKAALIRLTANTHQYSFDQTYVPLDVSVEGDRVSMTVPSNGNTIPAGQYMLFLVDSAGVPSKAPIVRVDQTSATLPNITTTQSSQLREMAAHKAFDGNTTNWANGEFNGSHTLIDTEPWWQVDFGRSRKLDRLTIYTRTDRFQDRTRNVMVYASDVPFQSTSVAATRSQPGVTAIELPGTQPATVNVPINRTARYVRIQLQHRDHLNLREVVPTFGTTAPALAVAKGTQTDASVTVRVTNTGDAPGTIQSVTMPGAGWSQTGGPGGPFTVPAGGETTLTLARGSVDGDLVLTPSSGTALRLALEKAPPPPQPDLSLERTGQTDASVTVRVANAGDAPGTITGVTLPGAGWTQTAGPSAPFSVPAGGAANLTLARGTVDGDLVLTQSDGPALRLALQRAPEPEPDPDPEPEPSTVPDPAEGGWQLNGAATITGGGLQLTPAAPDQRGTAFWPTALDPREGLTIEYQATIADGTGADGMTLMLADPARGATPTSIGGGGGHLGFGGIPGHAVALASYPNGTQLVGNFVGISDGARANHWQTLSWLQSQALFFHPLQNATRTVRVTIAAGTISVAIDGTPVASHAVDLPDRVLLGFSAATGGLTNRHAVSGLKVRGGAAPPPPPPAPSAVPDPAAGGWQLNGTAAIAAGELRLTQAATDQRGTAFWPTPLDVGNGLTVSYDATIADGTGADGMTLALADPARGATPLAVGGGGGHLGFGGIPGHAVALGTFPNGTQTRGNFLGISDGALAGAWQTLSWRATSDLTTPPQNTTRRVTVTVTRRSISASIDGGLSVTTETAVPERVLLGFTAATGGLTNRHAVANLSVSS